MNKVFEFEAIVNRYLEVEEEELRGENIYLNKEEYRQLFSLGERLTLKKIYNHVTVFKWHYKENYYLIWEQLENKNDFNVLDAGCGVGSNSIFFAMLGAKVYGIDIMQDRLNIAQKRKMFFENRINSFLDICFIGDNVFNFLEKNKCDIIFSQQSISHIHPAEDFCKGAFKALKGKGILVVCDSNWLNPIVRIKLYRQYWKISKMLSYYVHSNVKNPSTGVPVKMAEERMFSPLRISYMMRIYGLKVIKCKSKGFLPIMRLSLNGRKLNILKIFILIERLLIKVPLINLLGNEYIVVGMKN